MNTEKSLTIFENTDYSIVAEVTDPELCSSINEPCNFDSLTFKSSLFDISAPFLWTSDSIELLSDTNTLISHFTSPQIDSLHGISANNNPATLIFKLTATDPFGDQDSEIINIISFTPASMHSSKIYSNPGLPLIGSNSFGITLVRGNNLVPSPAKGIIACLIIALFYI